MARKQASGKRKARKTPLDVGCVYEATQSVNAVLKNRVIGQDDAIERIVCAFARTLSGLRDPKRPLLTLLLLGPSGVGKTETAKALAQALFGTEEALIRIDCQEYAHGHEISKLLGSPPGYVGHQIEPLLSQGRIDAPHRLARQRAAAEGAELPVDRLAGVGGDDLASIILFDEIEKGDPALWNALLGLLEEGQVTLGNNATADFRRSIVVLTSNVGAREIGDLVTGRTLGFSGSAEAAPEDAGAAALEAARRVFPPEFLNRFDETLVYSPLGTEELEQVFDRLLDRILERSMLHAGVPLLVAVSHEARSWILDLGAGGRFGARGLRRAMERELVAPLSRLIAAGRVAAGDVVEVDLDDGGLVFFRRPRQGGAIVTTAAG